MTAIEQMLGLDPKRPNPWGHGSVCLHWPCQDCRDKEAMADEIKQLRKEQEQSK
jgi:hypothetical protein